ncbi:nickel insertion protein [Brevibacillus agri]|uniref:nickel insertion protein n=1 Tax=Brevibacillus agri TaxID=51101 RepID=UPI0002A4F886|nr:nickel insertion protein [Brevibacillus agri]ELK42645.1 hypothetical protein D478_07818 [Brevibacillus agri BAB-2500]MCG5252685.1 LarC family nickel insertion protein [Brevibacillus agri]MED1824421.1 DUF111 family protein [Brevibacillus agri]
MKLVIRANGPLFLESLVKPLQRIAGRQCAGSSAFSAGDAVDAGRILDMAEPYRPYMEEERWQWETAALRELMADHGAGLCGGELYVQPLAVPFGLSPQVLSLASGLVVRETDGLDAARDFSAVAMLWLQVMGAKPLRTLEGELLQVEHDEDGTTVLLLASDGRSEGEDAIPVFRERRQHADEHIDEGMLLLQANVDDASPEWLAYLMEQCFKAGANDVHFLPVTMKKSRPGTMVQVMCYASQLDAMKTLLFEETTTFGIRYFPVACHRLARRHVRVETSWGEVAVKLGYHRGQRVQVAPEYESCAAVARANGVSLKQVHQEALELATRKSSVKKWTDRQERDVPPKN